MNSVLRALGLAAAGRRRRKKSGRKARAGGRKRDSRGRFVKRRSA